MLTWDEIMTAGRDSKMSDPPLRTDCDDACDEAYELGLDDGAANERAAIVAWLTARGETALSALVESGLHTTM